MKMKLSILLLLSLSNNILLGAELGAEESELAPVATKRQREQAAELSALASESESAATQEAAIKRARKPGMTEEAAAAVLKKRFVLPKLQQVRAAAAKSASESAAASAEPTVAAKIIEEDPVKEAKQKYKEALDTVVQNKYARKTARSSLVSKVAFDAQEQEAQSKLAKALDLYKKAIIAKEGAGDEALSEAQSSYNQKQKIADEDAANVKKDQDRPALEMAKARPALEMAKARVDAKKALDLLNKAKAVLSEKITALLKEEEQALIEQAEINAPEVAERKKLSGVVQQFRKNVLVKKAAAAGGKEESVPAGGGQAEDDPGNVEEQKVLSKSQQRVQDSAKLTALINQEQAGKPALGSSAEKEEGAQGLEELTKAEELEATASVVKSILPPDASKEVVDAIVTDPSRLQKFKNLIGQYFQPIGEGIKEYWSGVKKWLASADLKIKLLKLDAIIFYGRQYDSLLEFFKAKPTRRNNQPANVSPGAKASPNELAEDVDINLPKKKVVKLPAATLSRQPASQDFRAKVELLDSLFKEKTPPTKQAAPLKQVSPGIKSQQEALLMASQNHKFKGDGAFGQFVRNQGQLQSTKLTINKTPVSKRPPVVTVNRLKGYGGGR